VTRVVGRLPVAPGVADSRQLIDLIDFAANHSDRPATDFAPFSIGAHVWSQSTQLSVANVFGSGVTPKMCPTDAHHGIDVDLGQLAHFINCHGAKAHDKYYGQQGATYPIAIESIHLSPCVRADTVAAAECCFGAELYDFAASGTAQPICMSYLLKGAAAFVGSTNIAYGPASGNGQADLIAQYFLRHVLQGASTGRAFLQARQDFIRGQIMSDPSNLKTIAQFLLLGDPSLRPCRTADVPGSSAKLADEEAMPDPGADRKARRLALHGEGLAASASASWPGELAQASQELLGRLRDIAQKKGMEAKDIVILDAAGGRLFARAQKDLGIDRKVAIIVDREENVPERPGSLVKLMVAHIVGDRLVDVRQSESR
jgi:hypothetical protein